MLNITKSIIFVVYLCFLVNYVSITSIHRYRLYCQFLCPLFQFSSMKLKPSCLKIWIFHSFEIPDDFWTEVDFLKPFGNNLFVLACQFVCQWYSEDNGMYNTLCSNDRFGSFSFLTSSYKKNRIFTFILFLKLILIIFWQTHEIAW